MALAVEILAFAAEAAVEHFTPQALELLAEAGWEPTAEALTTVFGLYKNVKRVRQYKSMARIVSGPPIQEQQVQQQLQEQQYHELIQTESTYHPRRNVFQRGVKSAMKFQIRHTPDKAQLRVGAKRVIKAGMQAGIIPS
jgi:hypothetical protein